MRLVRENDLVSREPPETWLVGDGETWAASGALVSKDVVVVVVVIVIVLLHLCAR